MTGFGLMIEELDAGAVRIALRGELDLAHAYTFDEELRARGGGAPLVRRARPARAGVPRLLRARAPARGPPPRAQAGHRLLLVRGPAAVQRLFALSAVDEAFEMVNEVPVALAHAYGHPAVARRGDDELVRIGALALAREVLDRARDLGLVGGLVLGPAGDTRAVFGESIVASTISSATWMPSRAQLLRRRVHERARRRRARRPQPAARASRARASRR